MMDQHNLATTIVMYLINRIKIYGGNVMIEWLPKLTFLKLILMQLVKIE